MCLFITGTFNELRRQIENSNERNTNFTLGSLDGRREILYATTRLIETYKQLIT